ncbi:MAG TPA: glutamate--cysteine ligase [Thiolapillus brandeum]|uniref:Glutamate--cysteine ligase n=1 Tax=Thiolapillus brandeum TaxID=1076588 RepID=A0A831NXL8_9GAMM|nr:glutamate--cysteine ligase [Thiolapillus brandeum]
MGQEITHSSFSEEDFQRFRHRVVAETALLEQWMADSVLDQSEPMAGSEIEAWLVTERGLPAPINQVFLQNMDDPMVVPELSTFNVELNTHPVPFSGGMFDHMHEELASLWQRCETVASQEAAHMLMIGILPTVQQSDLCLGNISGMQRYQALNEQVLRMRKGQPLMLDIRALEHLVAEHDDVMLEAATTSFQIHLKIAPDQAARTYNLSKMISAPMVALSANSPFLFGHELWDETRIPLFEQSVAVGASDYSKRVTFGVRYAKDSIMECFAANRDRYPVLLPQLMDEPVESLAHLRLHNGTIWRWNRPLVGFSENGQAHIRIEHRVAPSGPSTLDVIANAAFYFGLIRELMAVEKNAEIRLPFINAKENFYSSACRGLNARVVWFDGQEGSVADLCLQKLIPQAREGLLRMGISSQEAGRWMDIIEARVASHRTGAQWQRQWIARNGKDFPAMVRAYRERQNSNQPVHTWDL